MQSAAKLVTPQGQTIILPPDTFTEVLEMVKAAEPPIAYSQEEVQRVVKETFGKYAADGASLTQALLEERAAERRREEKRIDRAAGA